tara:strand:+ start:10666 stop:11313 length:648 start_codon:yes stop_codon:yes gene_type:complete
MKDQYIEFKRIPFHDEANAISEILSSHNIAHKIESTKPSFDITFSNSDLTDYIIKVKESQFEEVTVLFEANTANEILEDNYYMNSYSDNELIEILSLANEWSNYDLHYANMLIKQRGLVFSDEEIQEAKASALKEQKKPKKVEPILIFIGYLCSIFGGWLGFLVAYRLKYKFKLVNETEKVPYYDTKSRSHGKVMLYIFVFWVTLYAFLIALILI